MNTEEITATQNVVIIGGGHAATAVAVNLRMNGFAGTITLISDEAVLPYQRPPLSKKYLTGEMPLEKLYFRPEQWYQEQKVDLILGDKAIAIDALAKTVTLQSEQKVTYDKLVIATGAKARELPESVTQNLKGVFKIRDLNDVDSLAEKMQAGKKVLIIGGGYIGLEGASVAAKKGLSVRLIEAQDRILNRVASVETADYFRALHQQHGVQIDESLAIEKLEGNDGVVNRAVFANGESWDVDLVIAGIGIIPNTDLAESAGLETDNGIKVDEYCQTSNADIFAAGDGASFPYKDKHIRLESVQNANDQGIAIAKTIIGEPQKYQPLPWFWSDQYDTKLQIAGLNIGYTHTYRRDGKNENSFSVWYYKDDKLLAVDAINDPISYAMARKMLAQDCHPSKEQIIDASVPLKSLLEAN